MLKSGQADAPTSRTPVMVVAATTLGNASLSTTQTGPASLSRRRQLRKSNDPDVENLVSFNGADHLLRASRLSRIMACSGSVVSGSAGSAATYNLSKTVEDSIDVFLSHNWAVGRVRKFAAMAYEFNFDLAAALTVIGSVPLGVVCGLGLQPIDYHAIEGPFPSSVLARACIGPFFFCCVLFVRDVLRPSGPMLFLDKTCIHQTDVEVMQAGIWPDFSVEPGVREYPSIVTKWF